MNEEDKKYAKTNSGAADNHNSNIEDYIPEEIVKIYPYRAINGSYDKAFTGPLTTTIVTIAQTGVDDFNNLEIDENGNRYLHMLTSSAFSTRMGNAPGGSTLNKTLRNLRDFSGITDQHFEEHEDTAKIDFATFGEPFDNAKYRDGKQQVFTISGRKLGKESDLKFDVETEGYVYDEDVHYSEMEFSHIENLISGSANARIEFMLGTRPNFEPTVDGKPGFGLEMENSSLLHKVRAKGYMVGQGRGTFYGDLDFNLKQQVIPARLSIIDTDDKLEMQGDWFNNRMVLPQFILEQYGDGKSLEDLRVGNTSTNVEKAQTSKVAITASKNIVTIKLDGSQTTWANGNEVVQGEKLYNFVVDNNLAWIGVHLTFRSYDATTRTLKMNSNFGPAAVNHTFAAGGLVIKFIKEADMNNALFSRDLELLEDMLIISAGFADAWSQAPVLTSGGDAGKIDPTFRVGHVGMKISSIVGHNPYDIIDGMIETHIRKYPDFWESEVRKDMFFAHVAALSRYIYSSYAIAKGGTNFNELYLPWYLEVAKLGGQIDYRTNIQHVQNLDVGVGPGTTVPSSLLEGSTHDSAGNMNKGSTIKFNPKSHYFKKDFSNQIRLTPTNDLKLPENLDISNSILVETDRKFLLPTLNETIDKKSKINFPSDIRQSSDLEYLFYIPGTNWKKLYIDSVFETTKSIPGTKIPLDIRPTSFGTVWTQDRLRTHIQSLYPGSTINVLPTIGSSSKVVTANLIVQNASGGSGIIGGGFSNAEQFNTYIIIRFGDGSEEWVEKTYENFDQDLKPYTNKELIRKAIVKHFGYDEDSVEVISIKGKLITYRLKYSTFTGGERTTGNGAGEKSYNFQSRPFKFDSSIWSDFINAYGINPNDSTKLSLLSKDDKYIREIEKIDIHMVWGNVLKLHFENHMPIEIKFTGERNESITKQTILFY